MKNAILEKFRRGERSIGSFDQFGSRVAVDCLCHTGLDYLMFDWEHTAFTMETIAELIAEARGHGVTPAVRISDISRCNVLKALDAGAAAIIVPGVETVEEVKNLVQWSKYIPVGGRGYCPNRDCVYGFAEHAGSGFWDYSAYANENTLLIPQCETLGAYRHIEEIVSMDGVDGIFIGPVDLSIAFGKPLQFDEPEVKAAIDEVRETCKKHGKLCMIFAGDPEMTARRFSEGFDSVTAGLDTTLLINSYRRFIKESGV